MMLAEKSATKPASVSFIRRKNALFVETKPPMSAITLGNSCAVRHCVAIAKKETLATAAKGWVGGSLVTPTEKNHSQRNRHMDETDLIYSYGVVPWYRDKKELYVLIAKPGGPWHWDGLRGGAHWTFPKGRFEPTMDSSPFAAAIREFDEETNLLKNRLLPEEVSYHYLGRVKHQYDRRKRIEMWSLQMKTMDISTFGCRSTFSIQWPPTKKDAPMCFFPEISEVRFCRVDIATTLLCVEQTEFIFNLMSLIYA